LLCGAAWAQTPNAIAPKPALTVSVGNPSVQTLPVQIKANGNIAAWQEASVGSEIGGLRLTEVRVNVGDVVKAGQVLAVFHAAPVQADLAQAQANLSQTQAAANEARANAERARGLQPTGVISAQQFVQYITAEETAVARVAAAKASVDSQQLRMQQTQVLAPDSGIIAARSASVGAVLAPGTELFRLIRQGRLEWRAEVIATELAAIKPGMAVTLMAASGARQAAPQTSDATRSTTSRSGRSSARASSSAAVPQGCHRTGPRSCRCRQGLGSPGHAGLVAGATDVKLGSGTFMGA
jgi:RND family efflux transporter MFP subunit